MTRDPLEGVSADGAIVTGAAIDRVPTAYRPVVAACTALLQEVFGKRLHGLYLYGSVATGQAQPPASDLDLMAVWAHDVSPDEVVSTAARLSERHAELVREVGLTSASLAEVLAEDRDGLGWRCFIRHYCVWLTGTDLRPTLPPCRPSRAVADSLNDDVGELVRHWRSTLAVALTSAEVAAVARSAARKLLLVAATLVLQRQFGVSWEAEVCPVVMITAWWILLGGSRRWMRWWS